MTSRKPRRPNTINNHRLNTQQGAPQPSDYESDFQNYFSDTQQPSDQQESSMSAPPLRSNEELNLAVLRRHNPSVNTILSLAPYAVVYIFSPATRQWEKSGVEGTLFVCQLTQGNLGEERYSVFVLNRRGLNNFDVLLTDGENVELTEEYVILKTDSNNDTMNNNSVTGSNSSNNVSGPDKSTALRIYGLWIYSEPPPNSTAETRSINAQMIRECAVHAGHSLSLARERLEATHQNGLHVAAATAAATTAGAPLDEEPSSVPMGRQVSLKDLFGQQRAQDDGWSVRAHSLGPEDWMHQPQYSGMGAPAPGPRPQPQSDVLGDLFRRAGLAYQGENS
ncbi:hypothetical protein EYZ11_006655 [Aspergillus tanneri]|uniref:Decapping enzyme Dcp1 n=1 Tax=Aspergillus tanneri TaxID=1220188 RepID=A0A4S3JEX7_9EURO|nr:uncharacterized protein ATNIH1004_010766 [Aspergillus tanneri]KAA8641827.1 hypothetical protein ATNIH1004_010766 [Aspergillus tanneri]THC93873.1 hypothetical protein EYZ11_006655 [Aspergillus tanneri]